MSTMRATVAAAVALVLVAGCSSSTDEQPAGAPVLEQVACPDDVEILVVPTHTCGFVVTVGRSGGELRIFTVAVDPPEANDLAPVLETGTDLGMTPTYGGLAPIAQRTGRRLVLVDLPGTGHSTPSLDCPEVEGLATQPLDADIEAAVSACRSRLRTDGVDPTDVTPDQLGEVLHDVMTAYDVSRWVVMGHGSSGTAALDLAGDHPESVEALVLDSVSAGYTDPDQSLDDVVADIAARCRDDAGCTKKYGDVRDTWVTAQSALASAPVSTTVEDQEIVVDETGLRHATRWLVGWSSLGPQLLPELLAEAASGRAGRLLTLYAETLTAAPPLCVGYLPKCESSDRVAVGAVLSTLCSSLAASADWAAACGAWGLAAEPASIGPVDAIPALALYGRYDPFSPPDQIRAELARLVPGAYVVEIPTLTHNVLGNECVRTIRNEWLAGAIDAPPSVPSCLSSQLAFD